MRILHISCQKPDSTGSGVFLAALVRSYARMGHENAVICGVMEGDHPEKSLAPGAAIFPVKFKTPELPFPICGMSDVMPYESTRYRDLDERMTQQFEKAFLDAIVEADRVVQPDLIICHHLYFVTALAREALPHRRIVAISHSTDLRQLIQHGFMRDRISRAVRSLDGVVALHEAHRDEIAQLFEIDPDAIHVAGVGFDSSVFSPMGLSQPCQRARAEEITALAAEAEALRLRASEDRRRCSSRYAAKGDAGEHAAERPSFAKGPIILYVGKIGYKKGVQSLVRAFCEIRQSYADASLVLVGGHSNYDEYACIRALAEELGEGVHFTGALPPKDVAELYRAADVFVLPSFFEGLPLVLAEALACGAKAVATDLPGVQAYYNRFLPQAPISFVEPPRMSNVDTPREKDIPSFEDRLAEAIIHEIEAPAAQVDMSCLDWSCVAKRVLEAAG